MFGLGAGELFVIFALALILLGPKKLPELARGLGKAIREFQNTKNDLLQEVNNPESSQETANNDSVSKEMKEDLPPSNSTAFKTKANEQENHQQHI